MDQIKYQVATGALSEGDQLPSVRQLAGELAVNQNTILKVYNQLCREKILKIERGNGTFVTAYDKSIRKSEVKEIITRPLREAAVGAIQFDMDIQELHDLLNKEYEAIKQQEQKKLRKEK